MIVKESSNYTNTPSQTTFRISPFPYRPTSLPLLKYNYNSHQPSTLPTSLPCFGLVSAHLLTRPNVQKGSRMMTNIAISPPDTDLHGFPIKVEET